MRIHKQGMAPFGKTSRRIQAGDAQGYLRSKSGTMTPLNQLGHIGQGNLRRENTAGCG